jgi:hypothetical protein
MASASAPRLSGIATIGWDRAGVAWVVQPGGGYRLEKVALSGMDMYEPGRENRETPRVVGVELPDSLRGLPLYMTRQEFERAVGPDYAQPAAPGQRQSREALPPDQRPTETHPTSPGPTIVKAAAVLEGGLLVVLLRTAAVDWQDAVTRYRPDGTAEPGGMQRRYDTLVDVIDVETGSLLSRTRLPSEVDVTSDGTLYRPTVSTEGVISFEAFGIEFVDGRRR